MGRWLIVVAILMSVLMVTAYALGQKQCRVQVVTKQTEVIKYVYRKNKELMARPRADRAELLELMRHGTL
jgi:hypothetical protein